MTAPLLRLLQLSVQVSLFHYLYVGILNKQAMDENFTHSCHKVVLNSKENYYCVCTPPNWVLFFPMFISHPKCMYLLFFLPCCCGSRKHENRLTEGQTDRQTDRPRDQLNVTIYNAPSVQSQPKPLNDATNITLC